MSGRFRWSRHGRVVRRKPQVGENLDVDAWQIPEPDTLGIRTNAARSVTIFDLTLGSGWSFRRTHISGELIEETLAEPDSPRCRGRSLGGMGVVGRGSGLSLMLNAHVDVVPPGDLLTWEGADPFSGRVTGDTVEGGEPAT
jgi:hypothetical protein